MLENVRILGTSHIAAQSLKEVRSSFVNDKPDILALELDRGRLVGLMSEDTERKRVPIRQIGFKGYLFYVLGSWLQKKLGRMVGVMPGAEMKLAIKLAKKHSIKIALIDRDIRITLKRFSQSMGWRERFNFIADIFKGFVFKKKMEEEMGLKGLDLTKVPDEELIEKLILRVKERYPGMYSSLIEERNIIMANNILRLSLAEPDKRILVIVGAGHRRALEEELSRASCTGFAIAG